MILDPEITCECDSCGTTEVVTPEYKYTDYSGDKGFYDCSDEAIIAQLKGWEKINDMLFCDECSEAAEE